MIKVNGLEVKPTIFPDKTSQVWKIPSELLDSDRAVVLWDFDNEAELIHLAQTKILLDSYDVDSILHISYLPYGRQDKSVTNQTTFALVAFADLLNSMKFSHIEIYDPHSDVALLLINNSALWAPEPDISHTISQLRPDYLCYPDKGAAKKYSKRIHGTPSFCAQKVRDQLSGTISHMELIDPPTMVGFDVLIVDDICDGGATFIALSKLLSDAGAKNIWLHVSHGLFTKGTEVLTSAGIKRIFTKKGEINVSNIST